MKSKKEKIKKSYRKAVFVVVYRKERNNLLYLILKRKLHWKGWEFPKGGVKNKETIKQTITREVKEETGQNLVKIFKFKEKGKYKYDKIYPDRKDFLGQTYSLFSAEIKKKKIKLDRKEHSAYKWLDYKKAMKILSYRDQKKCLRIVNKFLEKKIRKLY